MPENYCGDYYGWLLTTAQALEDSRLEQVDRMQVVEELRDMGKAERRALRSQIERVLVHMLKIRYQPEKHSQSWNLSIEDSRLRLFEELQESPSLRREVPALLKVAYRHARLTTAEETPQQCPFTVADILGKNVSAIEESGRDE